MCCYARYIASAPTYSFDYISIVYMMIIVDDHYISTVWDVDKRELTSYIFNAYRDKPVW